MFVELMLSTFVSPRINQYNHSGYGRSALVAWKVVFIVLQSQSPSFTLGYGGSSDRDMCTRLTMPVALFVIALTPRISYFSSWMRNT
jgi:hypothetical protein